MISFLTKLLEEFVKVAGAKAAPFALQEIVAISEFFKAYLSMEVDFSQSAEERAQNRQIAINALKSFIGNCESEGMAIAADLPGLIIAAGANDLLGAFGFDQTTATIAATPTPYS